MMVEKDDKRENVKTVEPAVIITRHLSCCGIVSPNMSLIMPNKEKVGPQQMRPQTKGVYMWTVRIQWDDRGTEETQVTWGPSSHRLCCSYNMIRHLILLNCFTITTGH